MKTLFLFFCAFELVSTSAMAALFDAEHMRQLNNNSYENFVKNASNQRVSAEALPYLTAIAEAPNAVFEILKIVGNLDASLRLRRTAVLSIDKSGLAQNPQLFISTLLKYIDDPALNDIHTELLQALRNVLAINSIDDTYDKIDWVLTHISEISEPSRLAEYIEVFAWGIPPQIQFSMAQKYMQHESAAVRLSAIKVLGGASRGSTVANVVTVVIPKFETESNTEVRIALIEAFLPFTDHLIMAVPEGVPFDFLSKVALTDPSPEVRSKAHLMQLQLRRWQDPSTRGQDFAGGSPWSAPLWGQSRKNVAAKVMTWLNEQKIRCEILLR